VDLRLKFKLGKADYDEFTVMIVLNLKGKVIAAVVDGVSDVVQVDGEQIRPTPEFGGIIDTRFISGIATINERMLILLDIESLILSADIAGVAPAAA
jgi:purine-binding chemotaxis protein CheW